MNNKIIIRDFLGIDDPYMDMADLGLPEVVVAPADSDDDISKYIGQETDIILC